MIEGLGISLSDLGTWAEAHVPGFRGLTSVGRFGTGQSNPTYALTAASGRYVLRTKPPGPLLPKAHQVEREARIMAALAGTDVPVPRVLACVDDAASAFGRAFFVMDHVTGRAFDDPALPGATPATRAATFDAMADTLAALHAVDPAAVRLADLAPPTGFYERQIAVWTRAYRASAAEPLADMDRLGAWLAANSPADPGLTRLLHGDYRHDNMILAPDAPTIAALLDWELATLGPPVADLAYQVAQWQLPHDGVMPGLAGLDRAALGLPSDDAYVARYAARAGSAGLSHWRFALAFSHFRLASILAGVARRAADGQGPNAARGLRYGKAVPILAAAGLAEAARA